MYAVCQAGADLLINMPTEQDHARLKHIGDVTNATTQRQVANMLFRNINKDRMPIHFVLNSKWQISGSKLMHRVASDHTVKRLLEAHKQEYDFAI